MDFIMDMLYVMGGATIGFLVACLVTSNKIEEAWNRGFERGKVISANTRS